MWIENHLDLIAGMRSLPGRQCEVTCLTWLEGYTIKETAEILGITQHSVSKYLLGARGKLRALLQVDPEQSDVGVEKLTVTPEDVLQAAARTIGRMPEADIQRKFAQLQEA
jgi:hypothetical protein